MQKQWPPRKWNEEARVRAEQRAYAKAAARGEAIDKPSIQFGDTTAMWYGSSSFFISGVPSPRRQERPLSPEEMMDDAIDVAIRAARSIS